MADSVHEAVASKLAQQDKSREAPAQKVCLIVGRLSVGGAAIHAVLLSHLLDAERFETRLITGVEEPNEPSIRHLAEERGVEPVYIAEMSREISWRDDLRALRKLISILRREKPDIVHTHAAKGGTLGRVAAHLALFGRRKRIYHTFHGHVFHSYFSPRKTRVFIRIEQILGRFTHRLIAVSEQTKHELVEYGIAPAHKIVVIPPGLDLVPFIECQKHRGELRRELGLGEEAALIGVVARLVPIKGLHFFLEAAACVAANVPNAHFIIVGDGELRQELETQANALGLAERVHFLGYRTDLPRIYADLDILALSSLNEGLPVSIIEAMGAGCLVVSTAVGGAVNLIEDGKTGFLVPPKNAAAMAAALEKALSCPETWEAMQARAQQFVLSNFHIRHVVTDIEKLYCS